ncbi:MULTISPECIES: HlyD family type I secretion periplasmic adaptor subunit [unclassified Desulfovibrio]|uniref:HlyD family type I secretion periplasmic adaptor subunit n=1 Tax=unclassified Desulfovibrio TaxID=2593640 RepID=UPI001F1522D4|nr:MULTISPECIES: HlyD family type I secretion periplasmic adaptor subunit [unclassified Desulfovibrio]
MKKHPETSVPESETPAPAAPAEKAGRPAGQMPGESPAPSAAAPTPPASPVSPQDGGWRAFFAEAAAFVRAIFVRGENEQTPDKPLSEMARAALDSRLGKGGAQGPAGAPGAGGQGLFAAMDAPLNGLTPDDIHYADEVDAALARRPRFGVRALSVTVAVMFLCLIIWAAVADIDEVTHAEGQVVGSQRTQTIQNLEGGILREVQVHEGQIVEKGAVLAQLDNEMAESAFRDAVSKAIENSLAIIRLEAEHRGEKPVFPEDLRRWLTSRLGRDVDSKTLARARQLMRDQEYAWQSRQHQLDADLEVLRAQYEQRERDVEEQEARKDQLEKSYKIAVEQRDTAAELMRRRNFARMEFLGLEAKVVELKGQIDMLAASIPKAQAAAQESRQRIAAREAEQKANITQEITKRRLELTSLRETISAGGDRVKRTELRAPVRGTVKQIHINTVGGVVKPGEPIMEIVPLDDTLLVEARVQPKDVAFLRPGQDVMVKVSAYDFSIYGGLDGKLESVSADTIEDKRGDLHYVVKVRTQKTAIEHHGETLPIIPGMMVTADILIGKKTVLDYLLKPILKAKQNALRER